MPDYIYLDHAAATPLDGAVLRAMQPYLTDLFYNPSALYWPAQQVAADIASARAQVAAVIGSRPSEIIFTAGGTEANNLAIHGVMRAHPGSEIIVSQIEHDAIIAPAHYYGAYQAVVTPTGLADVNDIIKHVTDKTVLISLMYANNEIGTIQPIRELAQRLETIRVQRKNDGNTLPLLLHTDACQAGNYLDLHVSRLGVDLMTLNGGKLYGPKQSGCLFVKAGTVLVPLIYGGGQERSLRSGTENVAAIIGFSQALVVAQEKRRQETDRLQALQHHFVKRLQVVLPQVVVNGSLKKRLPNNIHMTFPGEDNERLLIKLDEAGVLAAAGSACSASSGEPSHTLLAIGLSEAAARSSLRFSTGRGTTAADLQRTSDVLCSLVKPL